MAKPHPTKGKKKCPVTAEEAERMFHLWCRIKQTQGFSGVAKVFKRSITTVRKQHKDYGWEKRYERVRADVQRGTEKKIAREEISNLTLTTNLKKAVFNQLFVDTEDGKTALAQTPAPRDLVMVMRFEQEMRDRFPEDDSDTVSQLTKDTIEKMLGLFSRFTTDKMWQALGHFIVDNDIRPDQAPDEVSPGSEESSTKKQKGRSATATATSAT